MIKISLVQCVLILSVCLLGCASGTQSSDAPQAAPIDEGDTLTDSIRSLPAPAVAPGSVRVSALVRRYEEQKDAFVGRLEIRTIHQYGAATPSLALGTTIEVLVPKTLFGEDPDGANASAQLQPGQTVEVTLAYEQGPAGGSRPPWRAIQFH
ncbi:MAG: hypothetical protein ACE5G0_01755 [Rhodothermales bacterium]